MKVALTLCAGGFIAAAIAADQQPIRLTDRPMTKEETRFRALDRDNDRRLSEQEFRVDATSTVEFTVLDRDGDGYLSMAEFTSRPIPPAKTPPRN